MTHNIFLEYLLGKICHNELNTFSLSAESNILCFDFGLMGSPYFYPILLCAFMNCAYRQKPTCPPATM